MKTVYTLFDNATDGTVYALEHPDDTASPPDDVFAYRFLDPEEFNARIEAQEPKAVKALVEYATLKLVSG